MTIEFIRGGGHGVQPAITTGQPGGFQQASNPFRTPVPHTITTHSRYNVYGGPPADFGTRPNQLNSLFEAEAERLNLIIHLLEALSMISLQGPLHMVLTC